ncbi:ABC transporter ATP-binding protein [uncultured Dysosmobacter sp.]|uniref:ABC transporter ATP-binding protein n=1 Tax=uncultured Dysosmobacter sp. TaxID=2591384 RepID=UPI0026267084|nr:ABC transporter ATP-binding protein [uncultured Dysosmobacter sp.]
MSETRKTVIECKHVSKTFYSMAGDNLVVSDLNFNVYENEFVVLFGPGQCGKSTILNLISGLESPTGGEIVVSGEKVSGPSPKRGMVYQTTNLFMWYTVMQNVEFGPKMQGVPKKIRRERAQKYIDLVGLNGFENQFPVKLSGGMQQRVGIARAYANEPELICMDEPFGHLDAQTRYLMEEEVERISNTARRTVVFVTNNAEEAIYLADRIILLHNCPTSVHKEYTVDLPRPRDYTSPEFLALREQITADMDNTL